MNSKRILIFSSADDFHSAAVAYATRRKGHFCQSVFTPDLPTLLNLSLHIGQGDPMGSVLISGPEIDVDTVRDGAFDTIWVRRRPDPVLPENMHCGDKRVAERQCKALLRATVPFLNADPHVFWVNHFSSSEQAGPKPIQLRVAQRVGFPIPETLISNNPNEIRAFTKKHVRAVVHKLLEPAAWLSEDKSYIYLTYTSCFTEDQLPEDDVLRLSPGIFQPLLEKRFEVRVACLGEFLVAVRLNSQSDKRAALDWRAGQFHIGVEPYELPPEVSDRCKKLMHVLGLVHASLDLVVDLDGNHIFLEANPQGQFLWMEDRAEIPLLDMFTEFLIGKRREFDWHPDHEIIRLKDFINEQWEYVSAVQIASHCPNRRRDELLVSDAANMDAVHQA